MSRHLPGGVTATWLTGLIPRGAHKLHTPIGQPAQAPRPPGKPPSTHAHTYPPHPAHAPKRPLSDHFCAPLQVAGRAIVGAEAGFEECIQHSPTQAPCSTTNGPHWRPESLSQAPHTHVTSPKATYHPFPWTPQITGYLDISQSYLMISPVPTQPQLPPASPTHSHPTTHQLSSRIPSVALKSALIRPSRLLQSSSESSQISDVSHIECVQRCGMSEGYRAAWISGVCVCVGCVFLV